MGNFAFSQVISANVPPFPRWGGGGGGGGWGFTLTSELHAWIKGLSSNYEYFYIYCIKIYLKQTKQGTKRN